MKQFGQYGEEIRRSLNLVILGITLGMAYFTVFNGPSFNAFIRTLGAGDFVYSMIIALPILGGVIQIFGSFLMEHKGRRKGIFLSFGFVHRLIMIPVALIPVFIPEVYQDTRITLIVICLLIGSCSNAMVGITFNSWMGSLIPTEIRGQYFSYRSMISTISAAVTTLAVGWFLDLVPGYTGYSIVFIIVALFGAADILCFVWVHEPDLVKSTEKLNIKSMLTIPLKNSNYRKFMLFTMVWTFGAAISSPFISIYQLEQLELTFFQISLATQFASNIMTILFIRKIGSLIDRFGMKPVQKLACIIVAVLPFLWTLATPDTYYLAILIGILQGLGAPSYDMTTLNLSIWLAPEKNRSVYLAFYALILALLGTMFGNMVGGFMMETFRPLFPANGLPYLPGRSLNPYHLLFIATSLVQLFAIFVLQPRFTEDKAGSLRMMLRYFAQGILTVIKKLAKRTA
ncbi:MAG: MFS transporter [Thermoclostridium sp.]|nr:MFS transporter [Thermoclostridium sp.]